MQIINYREQPAAGSVIGIFDVRSDKMRITFRDIEVRRGKNGHKFISFPAKKRKDDLGNEKWMLNFEFDGEVQKKFVSDIFQALEPYLIGR